MGPHPGGLLQRRRRTLVLLTLTGLVAALAYVLLQQSLLPRHRATASLFVSTASSSAVSEGASGAEDPGWRSRPVDSFASVAKAPIVLRPVIARLGLPLTTAQLAQRVSARTSADSAVLDVTATGESARAAVRIAGAVASQLVTVASKPAPQGGTGSSSTRLTVVRRAHPVEASGPDVPLALALGSLAGLLAGLLVAGLREPRVAPGWDRLAR
jgi:capsular polysaccharide biosynthesis protein